MDTTSATRGLRAHALSTATYINLILADANCPVAPAVQRDLSNRATGLLSAVACLDRALDREAFGPPPLFTWGQ